MRGVISEAVSWAETTLISCVPRSLTDYIKYVCAKLWQDTYRLELTYNGVVFVDREGAGVDVVEQSLASCCPSRRLWLKKITILGGGNVAPSSDQTIPLQHARQFGFNIPTEQLAELDAFYFYCPWMSVQLALHCFRVTKFVSDNNKPYARFWDRALWIIYLLRNKVPLPFEPSFSRRRTFLGPMYGRDVDTPPLLQAPNLRVYPRNLVRGTKISELVKVLEDYIAADAKKKPCMMEAREWLTRGI
jgi:hypothetical protein